MSPWEHPKHLDYPYVKMKRKLLEICFLENYFFKKILMP